MTQPLVRLEIIFDTDHGSDNEGWYVRMSERSTIARQGSQIDEPVDLDIREDAMGCLTRRAESRLRGEARRVARSNGYTVPSSLAVEIE